MSAGIFGRLNQVCGLPKVLGFSKDGANPHVHGSFQRWWEPSYIHNLGIAPPQLQLDNNDTMVLYSP